jgi:penicillin-binding protein 1A
MRIFRSRVFRLLFGLAALFTLAIAGLALYVYQEIERELPDLEKLTDYRPALTSTVYDRKGRPIGEFFEERRRLEPVGKIPKLVVQAFVAGEDETFFEHTGLDYMAILRAAWVNLRAGGKVKQGGSTITQQVAKSLLLSSERSVLRKLKDMVLARRIEQHLSKDEILYLYLNQIYLGHGAYGVGQAAHTYFGKDVADLTPSEAALIAGLPKAPSDYSPYNNPEAADNRRRYVLERMLHEGYLDPQQYETALASPPRLVPPPERDDYAAAGYFTEEVRRLLFDRLGSNRVLRGGLTIETTLDLDLQHTAVSAVRAGTEALERRHSGYRGPLRRVPRGTENAALAEIASENGFARAVVAQGGIRLSPIKNYSGLVTAVDAAAGSATVAVAPGVEATLHVDDVVWALKKLPEGQVHEPKAIATVLHVDDVAKFALKRPDAPSPAAPGAPSAAPAPKASPAPLHLVLTQEPRVEGALVSRDVTSGEVLALVGGYDFARSEFDRATQARRQPGSAFKPFVYGAALLDGFTPVSILMDTPVVMIDPGTGELWKPENYTRKFLGALTAREALARSINNATIHLFMDVGVNRVIEFAHELGIRSPLGHNPSLALGSTEVSLLELTAAYTTIAAQGMRTPPVFITRVLDRDGHVLLGKVALGDISSQDEDDDAQSRPATDAAELTPSQVIAPEPAFLLTSLLRATVEEPYGTAHKAASLGRPLAGKTGTTDDQKDAWFVGFSPEIATGVWVGHDEKEVLGDKETGARAALPIWTDFMEFALADKPIRDFPVPQGIVFARVSKTTGLLAEAGDPSSFFEPFAQGTEPSERHASASPDAAQTEGYDLLRNDSF